MTTTLPSPRTRLWLRFLPLCVGLAITASCHLVCPYRPENLIETQVRAECHFWFNCCAAGEHARAVQAGFPDLRQYRDEWNCVEERLEEGSPFSNLVLLIRQAEDAGRFEYSYAAAESCAKPGIDALWACDADFVIGDKAPREPPEICQGVPGTGKVANRGACYADFECATRGARCLPPALFEEPDPDADPRFDTIVIEAAGICEPPLREGEDCSVIPDFPLFQPFCEPGTFCRVFDNGDLRCAFLGEESDRCRADGECEKDLYCRFDGGEGRCRFLKEDDERCEQSRECESRICDLASATPRCIPPPPVSVLICDGIQGAADPVY